MGALVVVPPCRHRSTLHHSFLRCFVCKDRPDVNTVFRHQEGISRLVFLDFYLFACCPAYCGYIQYFISFFGKCIKDDLRLGREVSDIDDIVII